MMKCVAEHNEQRERNKSMTEQQKTLQEQITARAMKDEAFRQQLLSNPKETLERELGLTFPQGATIQVHEDTPTTIHLVLPMRTPSGQPQELSDEDLEQASGGRNNYITLP
jgi:Nitrile hydratase, alpha chain